MSGSSYPQVSDMAFDGTVYPAGCTRPDLQVGQAFEANEIPAGVRVAICTKLLGKAGVFAMMGDSIEAVKTSIGRLFPDADEVWPKTDAGEVNVAEQMAITMRLCAVWSAIREVAKVRDTQQAELEKDPDKMPMIPETEWTAMRRAFKEGHPELRFDDKVEPHRLFLNKMARDYKLYGRVVYYAMGMRWTVADKVGKAEDPVKKDGYLAFSTSYDACATSNEEHAVNRITAFLYALEFLQVMKVEVNTSLEYLRKVRKMLNDYPGQAYVMYVDQLFFTYVDETLRDEAGKTYSEVFVEALTHFQEFRGQTVIDVKAQGQSQVVSEIAAHAASQAEAFNGDGPPGSATKRRREGEDKPDMG